MVKVNIIFMKGEIDADINLCELKNYLTDLERLFGTLLTKKGITHDPFASIRTKGFKKCSPGGHGYPAADFLFDLDRGLLRDVSSFKGKRCARESLGQKGVGVFNFR